MEGYTVVDHLYLLQGVMYFARAAEHERMERVDVLSWKDGEREDWKEKGSEGESEAWWHEVKANGRGGGKEGGEGGVRVLGGVTVSLERSFSASCTFVGLELIESSGSV